MTPVCEFMNELQMSDQFIRNIHSRYVDLYEVTTSADDMRKKAFEVHIPQCIENRSTEMKRSRTCSVADMIKVQMFINPKWYPIP